MTLFLQNVFSTLIFFLAKNQYILKFGKIRKYMWSVFLKHRFHPITKHLYQNWKAENMPMVASRLAPYLTAIQLNYFEDILAWKLHEINSKTTNYRKIFSLINFRSIIVELHSSDHFSEKGDNVSSTTLEINGIGVDLHGFWKYCFVEVIFKGRSSNVSPQHIFLFILQTKN